MITPELLQQVADAVASTSLDEAMLAELRSAFPGMHFSYCLDDDVGAVEPGLRRPTFNLYLVDGREHCLALTNNPAAATGLLVAEITSD